MKPKGRPKGQKKKILMAFRFNLELADAIKQIAARNRLPQARILEILVARHGKDLVL
ncbi:MAG TPA: hypothetical protein VH280_06840 [Verrucomicrobiae bacterium]|jgi:hypothetical protein|nr:hypothetical protein [Verrucomicrobiae bacterium]